MQNTHTPSMQLPMPTGSRESGLSRFQRIGDSIVALTPAGDELKNRIIELRAHDREVEVLLLENNGSQVHDLDPSARTVICARRVARLASADDFKLIVAKDEVLGDPSILTAQEQQTARQRTQERYEWLERLEGEAVAEDAFFDSHKTRFVRERLQREQQIATWEAELNTKNDRRHLAIKLVLKFKADEHSRREARVASAMARIADSSFPAELRLQVMEHMIKSLVPYWHVKAANDLDAAEHYFIWPEQVPEDDRKLLRQTAMEASFKVCIIKLPFEFSPSQDFAMPSSLEGSSHNIRRLVLELRVVPRNGGYHRELNKAINGMSKLAALFPRLRVCVIILYIYRERYETARGFIDALSNYTNFKRSKDSSQWVRVSLEDSLVELISTFVRSGPGKRKLVRLSRQGDSRNEKHVEPLFEAKDLTTMALGQEPNSNANNFDGEQENREDPSAVEARRIFNSAVRAQLE